jgi:GT2 family glycosyltransferase
MNSGASPDVSIIIVSYNTCEFLRRCLTSLREDPSRLVGEIIVVDNASTDGSREMIGNGFPEVTLVSNPSNVGYARAVNQGIRAAAGRYFLILNPDIETGASAIESLREFMEKTPDSGIVACRLLNPDGTLQMSCRTFYTLPVVLLRRTFLGRLFPNSALIRRHLMSDWDHLSDREVDWVTGACMMVRREAYESVGGMDERFFLYFEDVDWCYRMKKHGWKVYYVHSGEMIHHYRRQSARISSGRKLLSHVLSTFRFYDKWAAPVYAVKRERRAFAIASTVIIDIVFLNISFLLAYYLRLLVGSFSEKPLFPLAFYRGFIVFVDVVCLTALAYSGLYRRDRIRRSARDFIRIGRALFLGSLVIMASTYLTRTIAYSRFIVIVFWPISSILVTVGRSLVRGILARVRRGRFDLQRVVVVGGDDTAVDLKERLVASGIEGYDFVGYVLPAGRTPEADLKQVVGDTDRIGEIVREHRISQVVISDRRLSRQEIGNIVIAAGRSGAEARVASEVTDILVRGSELGEVAGVPVVVFPPAGLAGGRLLAKRVSDYFWAAVGLAGLAVLALFVLPARALSGGDFSALSRTFRGLLSVLAGRRSLVGPAQPVEGEGLRPGITGIRPALGLPAGISGQRADMYYIQNWSLSLDLEIIVSNVMEIPRLFGPA